MEQVKVRWPCEHGYHYSHYDQTNVTPYTKCEEQRTVTLRRVESIYLQLPNYEQEIGVHPDSTNPMWQEVDA